MHFFVLCFEICIGGVVMKIRVVFYVFYKMGFFRISLEIYFSKIRLQIYFWDFNFKVYVLSNYISSKS